MLLFSISSKAQLTYEQTLKIDSLKEVISTAKHDTIKIDALVAWDNIIYVSDPELDLELNQQIVDVCDRNLKNELNELELKKFKKSLGSSYNNIGIIYYDQGNLEKAMEYNLKSLTIVEEIGDKIVMSASYNNIGIIYKKKGNLEKAVEYYAKSFKIDEEIGDKKGMGSSYNNIGMIYKGQGNYEKALEYIQKSLKIREEIGDNRGISTSYNNIGTIYFRQGNIEKAMEYYLKTLKIREELGDKKGISSSYNNIGNIYRKQGNLKMALEYFLKTLKIKEELVDKRGMGNSYNNIGVAYKDQGNYEKALDYLLKSKNIKQEINTIEDLDETSAALSKTYKKLGKYKQALEMHELYMETKDSIAKMDAEEELYKFEVDKEYELKKQADSIKHADEILIQQAENLAKEEQLKSEKQRRTGLLVIVGLVLVSLGFVFVQLRKTRAQKVVIEGQHQKLNQSHQEITDSINYAKRIQDALMTSTVYMKDVIPESFIFFQPKDVVSGDFYWVHKSTKGPIYFTVADCTGHGVPGAFMSMIGTSLLNEFIIENNLEDTAEILTNMRKQIIKSLKQEGVEADNKDGMDMALCKYDPKNKTLQYSGAYNPLIHISNREINHIKADNQPVALHTGKKIPFTSHEIKVQKGDMLYIYSDGFADQFGGERGRKYMSGKFKKFLLSISEMTTEEQEYLVKVEFTNWMGENEQIDDVCVMGVRIT